MVYTYTPTYYTSLHDSITSLCKSILPFSFKKRRIPAILAAEQQLSKQQSDNLKWQQESYHQILNLMGLCKEGILPETEVSAFRTHLLETLIASPVDYEHPMILRDKLIFLQELLYGKCISAEEYHASKRPLLQRLALQGAEIEAKDVIAGAQKGSSDEEWAVIDLKDDKVTYNNFTPKNQLKRVSTTPQQNKGAASVLSFASSNKNENEKLSDEEANNLGPNVRNEVGLSTENPFWNSHFDDKKTELKSILMAESLLAEPVKAKKQSGGDKAKRKPFRTLFQREPKEEHGVGGNNDVVVEEKEKAVKSGKKAWGFDGFKKWMRNDCEDETAPLSIGAAKSDCESYNEKIVINPVGEGPDTKQIKRKLHPDGAPSDFFVDKVLEQNIKKELYGIRTELKVKNSNVRLTDEDIEVVSTRLPVDKADLKKVFPKAWCDQYGEIVLDVVRKEFKNHVGEMGNLRGIAKEKHNNNSKRWATFDNDSNDDENSHPNNTTYLFTTQEHIYSEKQATIFKSSRASMTSSSIDKGFKYNPFFDV